MLKFKIEAYWYNGKDYAMQYQGCVPKQAGSHEHSSCHTYYVNEEWLVKIHILLLLTNMVLQNNINVHFPILCNRKMPHCVFLAKLPKL